MRAFLKRMFLEASAECAMVYGVRKIVLTYFLSAQLLSCMGQPADLTGGCHTRKGLLGISHGRHIEEGGGGGETLCCTMGTMAAL